VLLNPWSEAAIQVYYGLTGSGKTYNAVFQILDWLKLGGNVITNINVTNYPRCKGTLKIAEGEALRTYDFFAEATGSPLLVVIDEAQLLFGARDYSKFPPSLVSLMTQHRKINCSMIVICQNPKMLDVNFTRLAYNAVSHYNLARQSVMAPILSMVTATLHITYMREMIAGTPGKTIHRKVFRVKKAVYRCYNTVQLLDQLKQLSFRRGNPFRKWLLLVIFFFVLMLFHKLDGYKPIKDSLLQAETNAAVLIPQVADKPRVIPFVEVDIIDVERNGDHLQCVVYNWSKEVQGYMTVPVDSDAGSSVTSGARHYPEKLIRFEVVGQILGEVS